MAKNTKSTVTETKSAAELKAQMAALMAQLSALKTQEAEAKSAERIEFADKLNEFLPTVNCADLAEFAAKFRDYRNGLKNGNGASRSKISDAEKEELRAIYRRAKAVDATPEEKKWANLSDLAEAKGHSYQNLRNWLIKSGDVIVQTRV